MYMVYLSLRSCLRPPYSIGGEAGRPWLSIQEHVCRNGWVYDESRNAADDADGGPKPCNGAAVFKVGGARTVMLICRDDFKICTHLCLRQRNGNRRNKRDDNAPMRGYHETLLIIAIVLHLFHIYRKFYVFNGL